jgi:hypothetical protein
MPEPIKSPIHMEFGLRGWAAIAAAVAILGATIFLAIGFFVFFLPVMILAPVLYWLLPKPKIYSVNIWPENEPTKDMTVIDGEFRVVDASAIEDKTGPTDSAL